MHDKRRVNEKKSDTDLIREYHERGGKITRLPLGATTPDLAYGNFTKSKRGRKKKLTPVPEDVIVP